MGSLGVMTVLAILSLSGVNLVAHGEAKLTLLEGKWGIRCTPEIAGLTPFASLAINARDTTVTLTSKRQTYSYSTSEFLTSGLLAMASGAENLGQSLWFQIREDGKPYAILGEVDRFFENQCDDVDGTKKCQSSSKAEIIWSSEKIGWKSAQGTFDGTVERYGTLGTRATYFLATGKMTGKSTRFGAFMIDFGKDLEIIIGEHLELACHFDR